MRGRNRGDVQREGRSETRFLEKTGFLAPRAAPYFWHLISGERGQSWPRFPRSPDGKWILLVEYIPNRTGHGPFIGEFPF